MNKHKFKIGDKVIFDPPYHAAVIPEAWKYKGKVVTLVERPSDAWGRSGAPCIDVGEICWTGRTNFTTGWENIKEYIINKQLVFDFMQQE